jgi:hypothetical protein
MCHILKSRLEQWLESCVESELEPLSKLCDAWILVVLVS